jgi:hypothetical protein
MNGEKHTGSSLPDFLRHYPKDRDNLNHDLDDDVYHGRRRSNLDICLKTLEKVFHTAEQIDKGIFTRADIFDGLRGVSVIETPTPSQGIRSLGGEFQCR